MKHLLYILLLASSFSIHSEFKDWESKDKILWTSYVSLNAIDTLQTFNLIDKQRDSNYRGIETNWILGNRPTKSEMVLLKLGINYLTYKVLDNNPKYRTEILGIMNGIYIKTIQNNHEIGLRLSFKIGH